MAHRRSLGFARDDKKEMVVAQERVVAEPRHLSNLIRVIIYLANQVPRRMMDAER
jgi:hypothetical protein